MDHTAIEKRIIDLCQHELELDYEKAADVAFHMTDWLRDFEKLHRLFSDPEAGTDDEAVDVLVGFLVHAPNHIAAAAKLATQIGVADIFEVGAMEPEDDDSEQIDGEGLGSAGAPPSPSS
ncbi:MAG: hypothetical protein HN742_01160 [Lentisphaerae bacterium]|nr:hypothetical protein [Lentisphaerota bacterium]MBT5605951.1 hypothetical protein [Lentisphaerota bacterium]MBT7058831.1 hypothetical protein [Lentisphaerota bacterium]MBT7840442.1 hypothetical protein [Lentisphaerota bacterium]